MTTSQPAANKTDPSSGTKRGRRCGGGGDGGGALGGLVPGGGGARGESDDARGADRCVHGRFLPGRMRGSGRRCITGSALRDFLLDGRLWSVLVRDWNLRGVHVFSLDLVVVVAGGFLDARVLAVAAAAVLTVRL